jgi:hypothetical protein
MTELAAVLDATRDFVRRYVVLTEAQATAVALWIAHTHATDASETTPYLSVTSAEKRSGKTRLLEVLEALVRKPLVAANVSAAALFRSLGAEPTPTLLMDEVDAIWGAKANGDEDVRALLNAGYRRGTPVLRCVGEGARQSVEAFPVFGAKALAGIGRLPDTLADRSVPVRLKRRARSEDVSKFHRRDAGEEAEPLRQALEALASHHVDHLAVARPELPEELDDRAQDAYEPLVAIADVAGGDWPAQARAALVALRSETSENDETAGVRLLGDVRRVFEERDSDRLATAVLLEALRADEEAPWADWRGKGLSARGLARILAEFGVKSRTIRLPGDETAKGYLRESFEDAWERYTPGFPTQNVTPSHRSSHAGLTRDGKDLTKSQTSRPEPFTDAGCDGVTDRNAKEGDEGLMGDEIVAAEVDLGTATFAELQSLVEEPTEARTCRCSSPVVEVDEDGDRVCFACGKPLERPLALEDYEAEEVARREADKQISWEDDEE